jgi:hypothetical protein
VEQAAEAACRRHEDQVEKLVKSQINVLSGEVMGLLREHLEKWLRQHEINRSVDQFLPAGSSLAGVGAMESRRTAGQVAAEVALAVTAALTAVTVTVIAVIKIKILVILFLAHPIVAALVGLAGALGFAGAREYLERKVKEHDWGGVSLWMLHRFMGESNLIDKLSESEREARSNREAETEASLVEVQKSAVDSFERLIDEVIMDLSILDATRKA